MKKLLVATFVFFLAANAVNAQDTAKKKMDKMEHKMKDCIMMKDRKMMVMKGGKTMDLAQDITLSNGTTVMKDGSVKMKDGKTMMMKEGDCIYMDGKMKKMKKQE